MTIREMSEATEATCDWGGCDDVTVAERRDPNTGQWLAVCDRHTGTERRPGPGRGSCHRCGKEYALNVDGRLRLHNRGFADRCPRGGQRPTANTEET